jgi:ParB family chromosome partitioning protein
MSTKRGGLGRGLSALIPGAPETAVGTAGLVEVPVNGITPNPKQPRTHWDEDEIKVLAASIREVGILQPIVVRQAADGYEVIAGERRLRAAKVAGLATVPVVIRETDDADLLREALIENIHRQDLGPIEVAEAFRQLLEELGLKQEELAERVGVSRSHIANTIRLLQLPLATQQLLIDGKIQAGHARAILALGEPDAIDALSLRVAAEDLSVRETEEVVRRFLDPPATTKGSAGGRGRDKKKGGSPRSDGADVAEVEEILSEQLATRVRVQMTKKSGKVIIEFGSPDDLDRIVSEIIGSGPGLSAG